MKTQFFLLPLFLLSAVCFLSFNTNELQACDGNHTPTPSKAILQVQKTQPGNLPKTVIKEKKKEESFPMFINPFSKIFILLNIKD